MGKISCCKDCSERHYNCHAKCKTYQAQRKPYYKYPDDQPYKDYVGERSRKIEHKNYIKKRRWT